MNVDLKYLRVAVVPTETGNGIDQSSTVEEILACDETRLFSVPDYFQAQNDSDIDLLHFSFLIDIRENANMTGCNTDGIDMDEKAIKIARIKKIILNCGKFNTADVQAESSPVYKSMGQNNFCLVERIEFNFVGVIQYIHDQEVDDFDLEYEELEEDLIDEILRLAENYETDFEKTQKRCED